MQPCHDVLSQRLAPEFEIRENEGERARYLAPASSCIVAVDALVEPDSQLVGEVWYPAATTDAPDSSVERDA